MFLCRESFIRSLGFCAVLLIASIPIALRVVCTVMLSLGTGELANDGAIVTKINAIEELAGDILTISLCDPWHWDAGRGHNPLL